jgi:hypothetical protein
MKARRKAAAQLVANPLNREHMLATFARQYVTGRRAERRQQATAEPQRGEPNRRSAPPLSGSLPQDDEASEPGYQQEELTTHDRPVPADVGTGRCAWP